MAAEGDGAAAVRRDFVLSPESEALERELLAILKPRDGAASKQKRIVVQYFINRIFDIDVVEQAVELDFYLKVNWIDPKWAGVSDDDFQDDDNRFGDDWWESGIEVVNAISLEKLIEHDEAFWVENSTHGIMAYTQRYIGRISCPMELHKFPFDAQHVVIAFESFHWKADDMLMFRLDRQAHQLPPAPGGTWPALSSEVQLNEYDVLEINTLEQQTHYDFEDRTYSQVVVRVTIKRKYAYYVLKIMLILVLIVLMSWVVFFLPQSSIADRINITVTLFLAGVAFNFVVSSALPKISYNTRLDYYLLLCYVYNVLTLLETVVVYGIQKSDPDLAELIDWIMLGVFPGSFLLYNIGFLVVGVLPVFNRPPRPLAPRSKKAADRSIELNPLLKRQSTAQASS